MVEAFSQTAKNLYALIEMIRTLRSPQGCPWDRRQSGPEMAKYVLEEACEVVDAVESGSVAGLREELGDLLFLVIFLAVMAEERGEFTLADVMSAVGEKMLRRHPHVFGDGAVSSVAEVKANWETIKRDIEMKGASGGLLDGIPRSLPALARAQKMTQAASKVGFDWDSTDAVLLKVEEEWGELRAALSGARQTEIREEFGDLLFTMVNLGRFLQLDAEESLRNANRKFALRFACIEREIKAAGKTLEQISLVEMDLLWEACKISRCGSDRG